MFMFFKDPAHAVRPTHSDSSVHKPPAVVVERHSVAERHYHSDGSYDYIITNHRSTGIMSREWDPKNQVLIILNKMKDVYKELTGNDLKGDLNYISVRDQAIAYDKDGILPGCSYNHYYVTAKFSSETNKEKLIQSMLSDRDCGVWDEIGPFTYLCRKWKSFYRVAAQIDLMKKTSDGQLGLSERWRLRHQEELKYRAQLHDKQIMIDTLTKVVVPIKQAHDEYQSCYSRIVEAATPQKRSDLDERLTIDNEILVLEPSIQQDQTSITTLEKTINEKKKKKADCEKNNIEIEDQIQNLRSQINQLQSEISSLDRQYNDLEVSRSEFEAEKARLEDQSRNMPTYINGIRNVAKDKIDAEIIQLWNKIGDLTITLGNLHNLAVAKLNAITANSYSITALPKQKDENNKLIAALTGEIATTELEKNRVELELDSIRSRKNEKIRRRAELDARLRDIQNDINYLLERRQNFILYHNYIPREQELNAAISQVPILNAQIATSQNEQEGLLPKIQDEVDCFNKPIPSQPIYFPVRIEEDYPRSALVHELPHEPPRP